MCGKKGIYVDQIQVLNVPELIKISNSTRKGPKVFISPKLWMLEPGEWYFVYRVLSYCNDFTIRGPLLPRRSFDSWYMLLLWLPYQGRKYLTSIRNISLRPPGISTNIVLDWFITGVIIGSKEGFLSAKTRHLGNLCVLSLKFVGSLGTILHHHQFPMFSITGPLLHVCTVIFLLY